MSYMGNLVEKGLKYSSLLIWFSIIVCISYWYRADSLHGWGWDFPPLSEQCWGCVFHGKLVGYVLFLMLISVFIWLSILIAYFIDIYRKKEKVNNYLLLIGLIGVIISVYLFSGDFLEWYLD